MGAGIAPGAAQHSTAQHSTAQHSTAQHTAHLDWVEEPVLAKHWDAGGPADLKEVRKTRRTVFRICAHLWSHTVQAYACGFKTHRYSGTHDCNRS
jgi:hypothetical protein